MRKINASIFEICKKDVKKQTSFLYTQENAIYECPACHKKTFIINKKYDIGYCTDNECNCFADLYSRRTKGTSTNLEMNPLSPVLSESITKTNDINMLREKTHFSLNDNLLKQYKIGYCPQKYWLNPSADIHKFGNIVLPMYDYKSKLINLCAKNIGSDKKINLLSGINYAYTNKGGIFNVRGIWNESVNIFLNPTDCLVAISNGNANSIFVNKNFTLPKIITFNTAIIFGNKIQNDIIDNISNKLKDKNINLQYQIRD